MRPRKPCPSSPQPLRSWRHRGAAASLLLGLSLAAPAAAHVSGIPSIAVPDNPAGVGELVEGPYLFTWTDADDQAEVENTIDWYYTQHMPITFSPWEQPESLQGEAIELDILETDPKNSLIWDTSQVPTGSYWLWSRTHDFPFQLIAFSAGVVTIVREGDETPPGVVIVQEEAPSSIADQQWLVNYSAFDPDGSGLVTIEGTTDPDGETLTLIAEDLPAVPDGQVIWDTSEETEGDWLLKATITDARGLSFTAWSRYFVRLFHGAGPRPDSGGQPTDAGALPPDAEVVVEEDGGEAGDDAQRPESLQDAGEGSEADVDPPDGDPAEQGCAVSCDLGSGHSPLHATWRLALRLIRGR